MAETNHNLLKWLAEWLSSRANGDWEHCYGMRIHTLDNPGWRVSIDLDETPYSGKAFSPIKIDNGDSDWLFCKVENDKFDAACSPFRLPDAIEAFKNWIESMPSE
jgi:hypothetical protein